VTAAFRNAPVDSGWLDLGVVRCGGAAHGDFAVLFISGRRHSLPMETTHSAKLRQQTLYLPSLVFFGIASSFWVWSIKDDLLKPGSQLFHAPLPNVFGNGSICWGTNKPPRAGASTIAQAWTLFASSPFNGHAADNKARSQPRDVRVLLNKVAGSGRKFPLRELLPFGYTVDAIVNELIGGVIDGFN
jgi:PRTRC genetic system protein B